MKWKALVAQLANRINQPHVIDNYMRKVYKAGVEEGKRQAAVTEKETAVLEGYVARDQSGYLVLHYKKPHRTYGNTKWYSAQSQKSLPRDSFPSVTWQSEPKKVRIKIEEFEK